MVDCTMNVHGQSWHNIVKTDDAQAYWVSGVLEMTSTEEKKKRKWLLLACKTSFVHLFKLYAHECHVGCLTLTVVTVYTVLSENAANQAFLLWKASC